MKNKNQTFIRNGIMHSCIKALIAAGALFLSLTSFAQADPLMPVRKEISVPVEYNQVVVSGDVTVILTNEPADRLVLEGNPRDISIIKTSWKNGTLLVNAEKKASYDQLVIKLPAGNMTKLVVNGDAEIFSSGMIRTRELEILLNGVSFVSVKYEGKLNVIAGDGYDVVEGKEHRKRNHSALRRG